MNRKIDWFIEEHMDKWFFNRPEVVELIEKAIRKLFDELHDAVLHLPTAITIDDETAFYASDVHEVIDKLKKEWGVADD